MTSAILAAINVLTRPLSEASVQQPPQPGPPQQESPLQAALRANRTLLLQQLQDDASLGGVRTLREGVKAAADWFCDTEDPTWSFVQELLLLLLALTRHLGEELERFEQAPPPSSGQAPPPSFDQAPPPPSARRPPPEMALPLSPDVLSISQQKALAAALQLVVSLGLCPHLAPGVGVPLERRSAFGAAVEKLVPDEALPRGGRRLLTTTKVLLQLTELSSLATLVFTRHLGDVMAALSQLGYQPRRHGDGISDDERRTCQDALRDVLGKVYQPIVIKELLILQGGPKQSRPGGTCGGASVRAGSGPGRGSGRGSGPGPGLGSAPAWLRRLCGQLLSERLMQPRGVQAVVRAILEGGTGGESDWRKCDAVARILVARPQQSASVEGYVRLVCPQILELLHFQDKLTALQFQRVATRAVLSMVQDRPDLAQRWLLGPLLEPLHRCTCPPGDGGVAVDEAELTRCVEDVYKVWVVGNSPSAPLLSQLQEVLPTIFTLFCFTKQNVSHLRAPCQEVLLWFLSHADTSAALAALRQLSGLTGPGEGVAAGCCFTAGGHGGARLSWRESCSDEDDELYARLSGEQWRLECLTTLLAELKDSDLPGDFFLELLQELTSWTAAGDEETLEEVDVSAMTLLQVEQQLIGRADRRARRLALLQVLAVMVESLQHSQLLKKTTQVVDFLVSMLQRACVGLQEAPDVGNPVESQTLSMGMGLVATLLSAPQLSVEDYSAMSRLLPPLQTLSQHHPDVDIQELASNLRAVVATHGAVRPENLPHGDGEATSSSRLPASSARPTRGAGESPAADSSPPNKPFSDWLLEACDPDVPTRAFALRILTRMVQHKDPEAVQAQNKVLLLFLENLEHEDSFVYLSAIQGLAALADSYPDQIMERLLKDFQTGPSLPSSSRERSLETRLKVGEVLMRASRAMGELAPHLGRPLLAVFLQGTRDPDPSVRASSLSNLGELCQRLDYALGPLAQELSSCLTALIKTEKEAEVRRAAVHVIALLLRGLSDKTTQVLRDVLLDLYRALKWVVRSDPDQVAVLHARLALEELDDVMRRFIFPQQKLEKKIVVLP